MMDYFTTDRIKATLFECERQGLTAMQMRGDRHIMRMVREFPTMAVSIMRELAQRLTLTNNQLNGALSELRRLRAGADAAAPAE